MADLIMMGLIALMVIGTILTFFMSKGWKKALYTFISFLIIIGLFILYTNKACGPNAKDVEIMTPQAEAVSNYILKNGIPESLAKIPNLPYKFEECKWTEKNVEWCYFNVDEKKYSTRLYFVDYHKGIDIDIRIHNKESDTGIYTEIEKKSDTTYKIADHLKSYSTKSDGICNPLRQ